MDEPTGSKQRGRIDPDPISIILAVLGALGSVASIASYLEGRIILHEFVSKERNAKLIEAISDIEAYLVQTIVKH